MFFNRQHVLLPKPESLMPYASSIKQAALLLVSGILMGGCRVSGDDEGAMQCEHIPSNSWALIGLKEESVTSIAVHPERTGIIYAGTASNFSDGVEGKLFKTSDCGRNWEVLVVGGSFRAIELSPDNPSVIYAVNGSILKSTDGGRNWIPSLQGIEPNIGTSVASLAIDPITPRILYAGTSGRFGGSFYKSIDGAETWTEIDGEGLEENWLRSGVTSIAIDHTNPLQIFVGTAWKGDVLRSTDGGNTWETTKLFDTGSIVDLLKIPQGQKRVFAGIRFHGLHVASINPYSDHWVKIDTLSSIDGFNELVSISEQNSVLFSTSDGVIVEANTGIFYSFNEGLTNLHTNSLEKGSSEVLFLGIKKIDGKTAGIYSRIIN